MQQGFAGKGISGYRNAMDGENNDKALERIDRALARIEAAARQRPRGDTQLEARHDRLRAVVASTIARLDGLIAGGGR